MMTRNSGNDDKSSGNDDKELSNHYLSLGNDDKELLVIITWAPCHVDKELR